MIILIQGLPGCGKTALAEALCKEIRAVHFNADAVRRNINDDLGFSQEDREKQASRMGWLCRQVDAAGHAAVADFVCPTENTRHYFGRCDCSIWMNNLQESRYEDTNRLFNPPTHYDLMVDYFVLAPTIDSTTVNRAVQEIIKILRR